MIECCADPRLGRLLTAYELGLLSMEETRAYECHLLECDACYEELVAASDVMPELRRLLEERSKEANCK